MSSKKITVVSQSAAQTKRIGTLLGKFLTPGAVVALKGELGSGKTTMVKGIAKGLGVASEKIVSSPTFVLIHEYAGREKIYHLDWYRLNSVEGMDKALAEECFNSKGVTLVEWPERGREVIPRQAIAVHLSHQALHSRKISILFPESPKAEVLKELKIIVARFRNSGG